MNLNWLETLKTVAETGSYTRPLEPSQTGTPPEVSRVGLVP